MRADVEDWTESRMGVQLALSGEEIDRVISRLRVLRADPEQHFHLSADDKGVGRIGDIEISVMAQGEVHNMRVMSVALAPGTEIPDPPASVAKARRSLIRPVVITALYLIATMATAEAASDAYITFATNDYVPILIRGVWASAAALVGFHATTLAAGNWKGRVPAFAGSLLVLRILGDILPRLAAVAR